MTREAGRALDAVVAEKVFGWTRMSVFESRGGEMLDHGFPPEGYHPFGAVPPHYSTDIAAAWLVVEAMRAKGVYIDVNCNSSGFTAVWGREGRGDEDIWVYGESDENTTAPEAICEAALAAVASRPRDEQEGRIVEHPDACRDPLCNCDGFGRSRAASLGEPDGGER